MYPFNDLGVIAMQYPNGRTVSYPVDAAGRAGEIQGSKGPMLSSHRSLTDCPIGGAAMRKFTTLGLLCFAPFIAAAQESGALRVKVVDGVSGRPVPDVTVVVFDQKRVPDQPAESRSSSSDERGVALFEGLPARSYRLKVEHSGFAYSRNRIGRDSLQPLVEVLGGGGTVEQVCKLFPPARLAARSLTRKDCRYEA
ncbi:MAG: carboxypeptidase-like regulatory domain-containing protein [Acidobacteriota bacterium]